MLIKTPEESFYLDFDPAKYATIAGAANACYNALVKASKEYGQDPSYEVFIRNPQETFEAGYGKYWQVSWESGPYEWAIGASFKITGPWGYTEPYYSFDLCFVER